MKTDAALKLTEEPEIVDWPETHYVFIEKIGPFMTTAPEAWTAAHQLVPALSQHNQITGYMSLYKIAPKIYRAGFSLTDPPQELPAGLTYTKFRGGKFSRFVLTGPYSNLGAASSRVFELVSEKNIQLREDFCIEHYVTDPRVTPQEETVTEILVPTA